MCYYIFTTTREQGRKEEPEKDRKNLQKEKVIPNDFGFQNDEKREEDDTHKIFAHDNEKQEQEMIIQKEARARDVCWTTKKIRKFPLRLL
jgi:hypothetical protein